MKAEIRLTHKCPWSFLRKILDAFAQSYIKTGELRSLGGPPDFTIV